ncbi:MAG: stage IV sporulation protein A [Lachnospiraceae bacterium]|nr:stage IV sporulation protein A [Lachnospiraceae bacterium]
MDNFHLYKDIEARTGGDIYIGVVGPVRTGKSTFIKRFMNLMVLPNIDDEHSRTRARDEMPQSAAGRTIMTTEPKFIPKEAVKISLDNEVEADVRLIDCVGFMVDGAVGHIENDEERLVKTPWFDYEIPFTQAAEIGTQKVIKDHSTIGIVVTTDGSFGELPREAYISAEDRTVEELRKIGKPYIILLNTQKPYSQEAKELADSIGKKHNVITLPVNCEQLRKEDILNILENVLMEFPVSEISFNIPKWLEILPSNHWLKAAAIETARNILNNAALMKDIEDNISVPDDDAIDKLRISSFELSDGTVNLDMIINNGYYYQILSEYSGLDIDCEYRLMNCLKEYSEMKYNYSQMEEAVGQVKQKGYGVVMPSKEEIMLDEPSLIKHGNKFGVKMKAEAPSINLIRATIETEIAPIVGSEQQAEDLIKYIKENSQNTDNGIWDTNIFGKSIEQIVMDGIQAKIAQMTDDCQLKLQDTLQKIINDSNGGMICIII